MLFYFLTGFALPWLIGILHLHRKDKQPLPTIAPFAIAIACIIDELGFYYGFWTMAPSFDRQPLSSLPFNLGIFPVLGGYLVFIIKKTTSHYVTVILMALFTTFLESLMLLTGKLIYANGWNLVWTFVSYLIPYLLVYWYYLYLKKLNIT